MKPILPEGTRAICDTDMQKTISEEDKGIKANEITLYTYQLFNGLKCSGPNCDNLTLSWCNIYGEAKDRISLGVQGASWKNVLSVTGGKGKLSYTAGLESTTGSSDSVNASATLSVSKDFGVAEAGLEITAGYAKEWNQSKAATAESNIEVECDMLEDSVTGVNVYAFSLSARNMMGDPNLGFDAVSDRYLCHYGRSGAVAPVCFPGKCDNSFAKDCQKCDGPTMSVLTGEKPMMVKAAHSSEPQVRGSFVEFGGVWEWADRQQHSPAKVSYLVLYNDEQRGEKYGFCSDGTCALMDGLAFGDKIILDGVFNEPDSRLQFTRKGPGILGGEYWRKGSGSTPDGKIEIFQTQNRK